MVLEPARPGPAGVLWTQIDANLGGLFVSYLATRERLDQMNEVQWSEDGSYSRSNKLRMKAAGAAFFQYLTFLKTSAVLSLAKSIEDWATEADEMLNYRFRFWKDAGRFENGDEAKEIRALANVIKHNRGIVRASDSESAEFLVTHRRYRDSSSLPILMLTDDGIFDIENTIVTLYSFLADATHHATGVRHAFLDLPLEERGAVIRTHLVPPLLGL